MALKQPPLFKQATEKLTLFLRSHLRSVSIFSLLMLICGTAITSEVSSTKRQGGAPSSQTIRPLSHQKKAINPPTQPGARPPVKHDKSSGMQAASTSKEAIAPEKSSPQLPTSLSSESSTAPQKASNDNRSSEQELAQLSLEVEQPTQVEEAAPRQIAAPSTAQAATAPQTAVQTEDAQSPLLTVCPSKEPAPKANIDNFTKPAAPDSTGYVINFPNVNIIEYIKFISKISNTNFIFNEQDLQFKVTIVSEEPTSLDNVMAALLQVLRINGLSLVEQGNNVIIYKGADLSKVATVVTDESGEMSDQTTPLITRVFRLCNLNPALIESMVKPMLSSQALIESSPQTRHLIVTDIKTNIEKIAQLLQVLDSPDSPLDIARFRVQNMFISSLVTLAQKILQPIQGDNTLVLVPQAATNTIFIVSTPFLIERSLTLLSVLDSGEALQQSMIEDSTNAGSPYVLNPRISTKQDAAGTRFIMYKLQYHRGDEIQQALEAIAASLASGFPQTAIVQTPPKSRVSTISQFADKESGVFNSTAQSATTMVDVAALPPQVNSALDVQQTAPTPPAPPNTSAAAFVQSLGANATQSQADLDLVRTISTVQWIQSSNSIVFSGDQASTDKLRALIQELDFPVKQVFIECLVLQTTIAHSLDFGVEYGGLINYQDIGANPDALAGGFTSTGNPPSLSSSLLNPATIPQAATLPLGVTTALAPGPIAAGLGIGAIGRMVSANGKVFTTLGALVAALQTDVSAQVLLNPNILTQDNYEASIFVGSNIPYQTQSIVSQASTVVANFEYLNVGTLLKITPLVANSDLVTLTVRQEISQVSTAASANNMLTPTTTTSTTLTRVNVPNNHFLVISGQINDMHSENRSSLPCLGGLPVIGALFGKNSPRDDKNNLIIFIRPHILNTSEELDNLSEQQRAHYEEHSNTCGVKSNWEMLKEILNLQCKPREPVYKK